MLKILKYFKNLKMLHLHPYGSILLVTSPVMISCLKRTNIFAGTKGDLKLMFVDLSIEIQRRQEELHRFEEMRQREEMMRQAEMR